MHMPKFERVDFDDMLEEELSDRKPAWKQLQENIKDSYGKVTYNEWHMRYRMGVWFGQVPSRAAVSFQRNEKRNS